MRVAIAKVAAVGDMRVMRPTEMLGSTDLAKVIALIAQVLGSLHRKGSRLRPFFRYRATQCGWPYSFVKVTYFVHRFEIVSFLYDFRA